MSHQLTVHLLTVHRSLAGRRTLFLQADEQPAGAQLAQLADAASQLLPGRPPIRFADWEQALRVVGDLARSGPLVVVLDEFQWLWHSEPHLDSILQRHWDAWERDGTPVTLVLCGSALSLMERLLDASSPLYGRAQYRPLVRPLDYRRAAEFAHPDLPAGDQLLRYAVLGGTPQYQIWAGPGPLPGILTDSILTVDESLHEEPLHLMRSEPRIRDPASYFAVVAAVARGATRVAEIANATDVEVPNLTKLLARLVELGYLEQRSPVGPRREPKRSIYRISDPYFRFWFRCVFPHRSRLAQGRVPEVLAEIERDLPTLVGPVFEDCCREWVGRYSPAGLLPPADELGAWWSRDGRVEVDVAGLTDRRYVLLGSCKWSRRAGSAALVRLLDHRDTLGPPAGRAQDRDAGRRRGCEVGHRPPRM